MPTKRDKELAFAKSRAANDQARATIKDTLRHLPIEGRVALWSLVQETPEHPTDQLIAQMSQIMFCELMHDIMEEEETRE